jgi:hypothetical protein
MVPTINAPPNAECVRTFMGQLSFGAAKSGDKLLILDRRQPVSQREPDGLPERLCAV